MVVERLVAGVRDDIRAFHRLWMDLAFGQKRREESDLMGRWKPQSPALRLAYVVWSGAGYAFIFLLYPFAFLAFLLRASATKIDRTAATLGFLGVFVTTLIVWGGLSTAAYVHLPWEGFLGVAAATVTAAVSSVVALLAARTAGRMVTVAVSYPFAINVFVLPPFVTALHSDSVSAALFPASYDIAVWILDNILWVGGLNEMLRTAFTLEGVYHVGMWFAIAFPVGWSLGLVVTVAAAVQTVSNGGSNE